MSLCHTEGQQGDIVALLGTVAEQVGVSLDGLDTRGAKNLLQTRQTVYLAIAGLHLVARGNHRRVGGEFVVDAGVLHHAEDVVAGYHAMVFL